MAITSIGYDGSVVEGNWVTLSSLLGGTYRMADDINAYKATAAGVGDRAVTFAPGTAYGRGVAAINDADITVNLGAVPSGSRWDLVALRRDWSTNVTSVQVVQGGSTKAIPVRNEGHPLDDQPLCLIRVASGSTTIQEIADLRVWGGFGSYVARDPLVLEYMTALGSRVRIGDLEWVRIVSDLGAAAWSQAVPNVLFGDLPPTSSDGNWAKALYMEY